MDVHFSLTASDVAAEKRKLHNQFGAWQTGDKTDRDEGGGRTGREGREAGKEATLELKFWMRRTNEMAQSIRSCHNASSSRDEVCGGGEMKPA